jgi:hypothetical protein
VGWLPFPLCELRVASQDPNPTAKGRGPGPHNYAAFGLKNRGGPRGLLQHAACPPWRPGGWRPSLTPSHALPRQATPKRGTHSHCAPTHHWQTPQFFFAAGAGVQQQQGLLRALSLDNNKQAKAKAIIAQSAKRPRPRNLLAP